MASGGPQVDLPSFAPDVSDNGNIIAFVSASTLLSTDPDTVPCQSAPPACLRPFVVDRQAGTTSRVPAPPIVTSRVVNTPGGPLPITYRVEASQVLVAPDGASIAVNASSIASEITNSSGYGSESWIYHRELGRVMQHDSGQLFASWDGRRSSYNRFVEGSVISVTVGVRDVITGLDDLIGAVSPVELAFAGNLNDNGRYLLYQTTAEIGDDIDGLADLYVFDRDFDDDGMASAWETLFGLNPSASPMRAADPDSDGVSNLAEFLRGSHPKGARRALPRRRRQQRLLPDPDRHRQPGHPSGDRGHAVPRRERPQLVRRLPDPGGPVAQLRGGGPFRILVLDGHRVESAARRRPRHDVGRRLRQPLRDRDARRRR